LQTDVSSLEEGVRTAALFRPDILYVGELHHGDDIPSLVETIASGVLVVLGSSVVGSRALLNRFLPPDDTEAGDGLPVRALAAVSPHKTSAERVSLQVTSPD